MTQREGLTEWIFPEKKKKEVPEEKEKKKQKTDDEDKKGMLSCLVRLWLLSWCTWKHRIEFKQERRARQEPYPIVWGYKIFLSGK